MDEISVGTISLILEACAICKFFELTSIRAGLEQMRLAGTRTWHDEFGARSSSLNLITKFCHPSRNLRQGPSLDLSMADGHPMCRPPGRPAMDQKVEGQTVGAMDLPRDPAIAVVPEHAPSTPPLKWRRAKGASGAPQDPDYH